MNTRIKSCGREGELLLAGSRVLYSLGTYTNTGKVSHLESRAEVKRQLIVKSGYDQYAGGSDSPGAGNLLDELLAGSHAQSNNTRGRKARQRKGDLDHALPIDVDDVQNDALKRVLTRLRNGDESCVKIRSNYELR